VRLAELPFEDWVEHAFSHAVRGQQNPWYFDADCDWWDPEPTQAVAHLTRLFEDPEPALRYFSDAQIAQGLTYLVNTSASGDSGWLYAQQVAVKDRVHCIEAVGTLFRQLFAPRCTPHLSHLSETDAGSLNGVCYMWWDVFPSVGLADDPHLPRLHDAVLRTLDDILALNSIACQESALHGLGHWHQGHEQQVELSIDRFVERSRLADGSSGPDPRILSYAMSARCGCVL
jgi:hypothetical protein